MGEHLPLHPESTFVKTGWGHSYVGLSATAADCPDCASTPVPLRCNMKHTPGRYSLFCCVQVVRGDRHEKTGEDDLAPAPLCVGRPRAARPLLLRMALLAPSYQRSTTVEVSLIQQEGEPNPAVF